MGNEYNYIEWKAGFTLNLHYQTMSNNSFNAKLIPKPMSIESTGILVMDYFVNGKILLSTYTYVDQTYIKIGIHADASLSFYIHYEKE